MGSENDAGDKTEQPTPKRLRDARQKGDIAKSRDLSSTAGLAAWALLLLLAGGLFAREMLQLFETILAAIADPVAPEALARAGSGAFGAFLLLSAVVLIPPSLAGLAAEFLQTGALVTLEKLKPKAEHLNPVEGLKRMVSLDNLFELLKTLAKAVLILVLTAMVVVLALPAQFQAFPALPALPDGSGRTGAAAQLAEHGRLSMLLIGGTLGAFLLVAFLDAAWQRHSHIKKLRMSLRDIRDEMKENEGDPHLRASRRSLHQEWANQNAVGASRDASALVVNPTHVAVALAYDRSVQPVPLVTAIGEGPLAAAMRQAAEEAGVPVIRHVNAARGLRDTAAVGDIIPRELFEAVAEIILWAGRVRDGATAPELGDWTPE
jgi:type III secretion protein U